MKQGVDFSFQNFFWKSEGTKLTLRLFLFFSELLLMRKVKTPFKKVERVTYTIFSMRKVKSALKKVE